MGWTQRILITCAQWSDCVVGILKKPDPCHRDGLRSANFPCQFPAVSFLLTVFCSPQIRTLS